MRRGILFILLLLLSLLQFHGYTARAQQYTVQTIVFDFTNMTSLDGWVVSGPGSAQLVNGRLEVTTTDNGGWTIVYLNTTTFNASRVVGFRIWLAILGDRGGQGTLWAGLTSNLNPSSGNSDSKTSFGNTARIGVGEGCSDWGVQFEYGNGSASGCNSYYTTHSDLYNHNVNITISNGTASWVNNLGTTWSSPAPQNTILYLAFGVEDHMSGYGVMTLRIKRVEIDVIVENRGQVINIDGGGRVSGLYTVQSIEGYDITVYFNATSTGNTTLLYMMPSSQSNISFYVPVYYHVANTTGNVNVTGYNSTHKLVVADANSTVTFTVYNPVRLDAAYGYVPHGYSTPLDVNLTGVLDATLSVYSNASSYPKSVSVVNGSGSFTVTSPSGDSVFYVYVVLVDPGGYVGVGYVEVKATDVYTAVYVASKLTYEYGMEPPPPTVSIVAYYTIDNTSAPYNATVQPPPAGYVGPYTYNVTIDLGLWGQRSYQEVTGVRLTYRGFTIASSAWRQVSLSYNSLNYTLGITISNTRLYVGVPVAIGQPARVLIDGVEAQYLWSPGNNTVIVDVPSSLVQLTWITGPVVYSLGDFNFTVPNLASPRDFISFWSQKLGGSLTSILLAAFLFTIALATRSLSLVAVASGVIAGLTGQGWYLLVTALSLAGLLWRAWQKSAE